jgi:hypothetical protein
MRSRWVRRVVLWTLALIVAAIVLAVVAVASLMDAQQACFFEYPFVACPDGQDWRVGLLTFAFFGVPVIWLVGAVVAIVGRMLARRQRGARGRRRRLPTRRPFRAPRDPGKAHLERGRSDRPERE